jgi:RHS repeat-associated protein
MTVYVDGIFEHHRVVDARGARENNEIHVMDGQSRIALVRAGKVLPGDGAPEVRVKYHLGDHLGTSAIVVGSDGRWINREEYYPYGETSLGSFGKKRFRFTGRERDDCTGLAYHEARYYAPTLMRWMNCDPAYPPNQRSLYEYALSNPCNNIDACGRQPEGFDKRVYNWLEAVHTEFRDIVSKHESANLSFSEQGKRAAAELQERFVRAFGETVKEVRYTASGSLHRIDISLGEYKIDIELKLHRTSIRPGQYRQFVYKAGIEGRVLVFMSKEEFVAANFGGKIASGLVRKLYERLAILAPKASQAASKQGQGGFVTLGLMRGLARIGAAGFFYNELYRAGEDLLFAGLRLDPVARERFGLHLSAEEQRMLDYDAATLRDMQDRLRLDAYLGAAGVLIKNVFNKSHDENPAAEPPRASFLPAR